MKSSVAESEGGLEAVIERVLLRMLTSKDVPPSLKDDITMCSFINVPQDILVESNSDNDMKLNADTRGMENNDTEKSEHEESGTVPTHDVDGFEIQDIPSGLQETHKAVFGSLQEHEKEIDAVEDMSGTPGQVQLKLLQQLVDHLSSEKAALETKTTLQRKELKILNLKVEELSKKEKVLMKGKVELQTKVLTSQDQQAKIEHQTQELALLNRKVSEQQLKIERQAKELALLNNAMLQKSKHSNENEALKNKIERQGRELRILNKKVEEGSSRTKVRDRNIDLTRELAGRELIEVLLGKSIQQVVMI